MRQFTVAAAATLAITLFIAVPASAERISGAPIKQNGQCWRSHSVGADMTWGTWGECAKPAAAPAATGRTTRRRI
jgi:hypothetical protein